MFYKLKAYNVPSVWEKLQIRQTPKRAPKETQPHISTSGGGLCSALCPWGMYTVYLWTEGTWSLFKTGGCWWQRWNLYVSGRLPLTLEKIERRSGKHTWGGNLDTLSACGCFVVFLPYHIMPMLWETLHSHCYPWSYCWRWGHHKLFHWDRKHS